MMLPLNDDRLMEDQLLTLAGGIERFAIAFNRTCPAGRPLTLDRLASLTRRAETPYAFLAELLAVSADEADRRGQAEICDAIGVALLDGLQDVIGEAFTGRAREAWSRAFAEVSDGIGELA